MSFLHFGLLWVFLPMAAIPVILHLLTLQRLRTVELSTFRFLFDSYVQQRRRMKFLEALIALLRTLFLLALIFSLARPVIRHWDELFGGRGSGRDVVLLVDCSASMNARTGGETALQRSKRAALLVVDRLGSQDRVTLLRVGARPEEVCKRFSSDTQAIRSEIEGLTASPCRANLMAAFSYLFGPETQPLTNPVLYLFSDLQAGGWSELEQSPGERLLPPDTELRVVNVGSNEPLPNRGLVGGAPEQTEAIAGLPIRLRPRVAGFDTAENEQVEVSFVIDDKEIGRRKLTLRPGETAEAELVYVPTQPGIVRGCYKLPEDRFPDDDSFRFTLAVAPRVKVVLVNGNPSAEPLEDEGLYLRTALISTAAEPDVDADTPDQLADAVLAEQRELVRSLDVIDTPEANLSAETLSDADVVVLANCGALQPAQLKSLVDFVAQGGGLLILPGDKVNPDVYNQHLLPAPGFPDEQLLTARLGGIEGDPADAAALLRLGAIDFAHPVFSVFADDQQRYLTKVSIYRHFAVQLPDERGNTWPLVEFAGGSPALVESRFGNGRVALSAFALNNRWSNLPMRPEFVPLVLRLVSHLKRPPELQGPSMVQADGAAEFVVSQSWTPATAKVTDPDGRVTPVPLQRSNSRLVGAFDRTGQQGYYGVDVTGGRAEQTRRGSLAFAVNLSADESDFRTATRPQLASWLPGAALTVVDASAQAQQEFGSLGAEREIWRPLILLVFVIIGVEFLLSTLGAQVVDAQQSPTATERLRQLAQGAWVGRMTGAGMEELVENRSDQALSQSTYDGTPM